MKIVILRGLSGSGKTTKALEIAEKYDLAGYTSAICSADNYFLRPDGYYDFNAKLLKQAHEWCYKRAKQAVECDVDCVIIDNTNTRKWEYEKYVALAEGCGYLLEIIKVGDLESVELYAERNIHKVPLDTIRKMAERFEET